jgi:diamine N-acetyltransferase
MIELVQITSSDLLPLQKISRQTFSETFSWGNTAANMQAFLEKGFNTEKLIKEINNPESVFYFARSDNNIIGYIKVNTGTAQTELQEEEGVELERIYVLKEFQGLKAGKLLLDKAFEIARSRKAAYIWLGVWEKNTNAIAFYEKHGFVAFSSHVFQVGDEEQTDIMMKLML